MIRFKIDNNIKELINWTKEIPLLISNDKIAESCARIFAERAKSKLKNSGALQEDINRFVNAITFEKIEDGKWRISAGKYGDEQLKDDMYYLEFGTGIVGQRNPHPEASKYGWKYNINKHSDFETAISKKGNRYTKGGWTFRRNDKYGNKNAFIAKDDIIHSQKNGNNVQTKGVIAVRYFYDTMVDFENIIKEALKKNGF